MVNQKGPGSTGGRSAFGQRLAAISDRRKEGEGKSVREILQETNEGLLYSDDFFRAIAEGDALGIAMFRNVYGHTPQKAAQEWFNRPWDAWKETIGSLSTGESDTAKKAAEIVATVEVFQENPLLLAMFGEILGNIGRPSRQIYSETQFTAFLNELVVKGLAVRSADQPGHRKAFKWDGAWYTRASTQKAKVAWPFVLRALGRVRRLQKVQGSVFPRIQDLLDQATIPSNPEEQNLNRLLQRVTDVGSMVVFDPESTIWNKETRQGDPAGLLAILIERPAIGSSTLYLMGVVADQPLAPAMMQESGYELPPLAVNVQIDAELEIGFNIQNKLERDEFDAVMRIQHLLRQWLKQEGKFRMPALPSPTSQR